MKKHHLNSVGQPTSYGIQHWTSRAHPEKKQMHGDWCLIEPLSIDRHGCALYHAFSHDKDHHNWTYLPYGPFSSQQSFLNWLKETCSDDDPQFYAVVDLHTNKAVGITSFLRITPDIGVIEVGHIHFSPLMQKTAIATEAMYLMMRHIFDELGYRRYEWKCDDCNLGSKRAALRLGFTHEGVFRQASMYKGRNRDTAWFSIIDSEWPKRREAFEAWLAPSNFDQKNRQFQSLGDFMQN